MGDDIKKKGRRPKKNEKWKTTSKKMKMEDGLNLKKHKNYDLKKNVRRPQKKSKMT
jgi:hypothetical protein